MTSPVPKDSKQVEAITVDTVEDVPPVENGTVVPKNQPPAPKSTDTGEVEKVKAQQHKRKMENYRFWAGIGVLVFSGVSILLITAVDFWFKLGGDPELELSNIIDLFKITATTALGFVIGDRTSRYSES